MVRRTPKRWKWLSALAAAVVAAVAAVIVVLNWGDDAEVLVSDDYSSFRKPLFAADGSLYYLGFGEDAPGDLYRRIPGQEPQRIAVDTECNDRLEISDISILGQQSLMVVGKCRQARSIMLVRYDLPSRTVTSAQPLTSGFYNPVWVDGSTNGYAVSQDVCRQWGVAKVSNGSAISCLFQRMRFPTMLRSGRIAAFADDGCPEQQGAAAAKAPDICEWEPGQSTVNRLGLEFTSVTGMTEASDGTLIVAGTHDGDVGLFLVRTKTRTVTELAEGDFYDPTVAPDGDHIVAARSDYSWLPFTSDEHALVSVPLD
jgi:hypothetical protein